MPGAPRPAEGHRLEQPHPPLFRLAQASFMLLLFTTAIMRMGAVLLGFYAIIADAVYLLTLVLWAAALLSRQTTFRWHVFYWLILGYFVALAISALWSPDPVHGLTKLATQIYLLSLPVLAFNLVRDERALVRAIIVWVAALALICALGAIIFVLFYTDRDHVLVRNALFHFGSLPPGNYPRFSLTFTNANMLCNYLTVSLAMLFIARGLGRIGSRLFWVLLLGTSFVAALTVSPGLGGIALLIGCFSWVHWSGSRRRLAWTSLACGLSIAAAFLVASAIAPTPHPTAPFTMQLPFAGTVWPSGRLLLWLDSIRTFLAHPLAGAGLGQKSAEVSLLDPSGRMQFLTDAHNSFLNIAAQAGALGFIALGAVTLWILRRTWPLRAGRTAPDQVRVGLGIAFLSAFVYEGFTGSFEDARHLWLLIGLFLVAERLAREDRERRIAGRHQGFPLHP